MQKIGLGLQKKRRELEEYFIYIRLRISASIEIPF